jgi:ribosomal protein L11 methyltransferase
MSAYVGAVTNSDAVIAALGEELLDFGAQMITVDIVPDEDWAESWKQFFITREVGKSFVIVPSWEEAPATSRYRIKLDPGQAFGTGEHATTRLCLEMLERHLKAGNQVMDVGCGSGILSIAACLLGAGSVIATEVDPPAHAAALENFKRNDVNVELLLTKEIPLSAEPVDVIVSNIVSAVIIRLAPDVARVIKMNGKWLISGIIPSNWPDVKQAAEANGFHVDAMEEEDGWIGACLVKAR